MLAFIAAQIGGDPEAFEEYARRAETRREQDARQTPIGSTCATADKSTPGLGARRCSAERSPPALPADRTARRGIAARGFRVSSCRVFRRANGKRASDFNLRFLR